MVSQSRFETVIGLEIHVQLRTETKLFCGCANAFGGEPNSRTCPVCLGMPGSLPVLNEKAVRYAVRAAQALGCTIFPRSRFARKNYFYPDLPKGYQISQFDQPLAGPGSFAFVVDGAPAHAGITRVHLEEDAGKSIHDGMPRSATSTYVDLNRCGVPLIEIVTEPDLRSVEAADAFLSTLRTTLLYLGVTDANMEEGSLRCDANISLRPPGQAELNPKTELKNLNSFRFMRQALRFEQQRQAELLEAGEPLTQSTRLYDETAGTTVTMRAKEEAHDYRYFPDPDLVPVVLEEAEIAASAGALPELPIAKQARYVDELGLAAADAAVLVEDAHRAVFFEAVVAAGVPAVDAGNWVRNEVARWLNDHDAEMADFPLAPDAVAQLLAAVRRDELAAGMAGQVMDKMAETGRSAADIIEDEGLRQISSTDSLTPVVDKIVREHEQEAAAYRAGREQVLGFLMGQVMRATGGKANPELARELLRRALER